MSHPRTSIHITSVQIPVSMRHSIRLAALAIAMFAGSASRPIRLDAQAADSSELYTITKPTELRAAPDAAVLGQLRAGTSVEVLARQRGWARVRVETWIPDGVLTPADTGFRAQLSAADVRADPEATRGKLVQWRVEFLALQAADPLRKGLADDEPYLLARGPGVENALLYLVVPPSLLGTARALQPLAKVTVTARVREGRSEPVGIPILDVLTLRLTK